MNVLIKNEKKIIIIIEQELETIQVNKPIMY